MFGAGIAIQTMINSIRNNLRRRPRKKYFDITYQSTVGKSKVSSEFLKKKASPELLEKIRLEAKKDQRKGHIKRVITFLIGLVLTVLFIQYFLKKFVSFLL